MTIIYKAKTHCAYIFKILAELLHNNLKTACFNVDETGIRLCMINNHKTVLINFTLESDNFTLYKFKSKNSMPIGINLSHFHQMLKSIKKKDSIKLFINDLSPNDLGIQVIPRENNRKTTSFIKIQTLQTLDIDIPVGYGKPIIVPSSDFQKMIKEMKIADTITVIAKNFHITFKSNAGGIFKRQSEFGETGDSDDEDENEDDGDTEEYCKEFDTEHLSRITKISGLGTTMQVYAKDGLPLLFKSSVGTLGKISIYIKSHDLMDKENR